METRRSHKETGFLTSATQKSVSSVCRFFFPTEMCVGEKLEAENFEMLRSHLFTTTTVARQQNTSLLECVCNFTVMKQMQYRY